MKMEHSLSENLENREHRNTLNAAKYTTLCADLEIQMVMIIIIKSISVEQCKQM